MNDAQKEKRNGWISIPPLALGVIITLVLGMVGTLWGLTTAEVSAMSERIRHAEIEQAKTKTQLQEIKALLKEVRDDVKEMRKSK